MGLQLLVLVLEVCFKINPLNPELCNLHDNSTAFCLGVSNCLLSATKYWRALTSAENIFYAVQLQPLVGPRAPLDEWSAPSQPDNTQRSQETDIHAVAGFEPAVPASERPETHPLDCATTGIGVTDLNTLK